MRGNLRELIDDVGQEELDKLIDALAAEAKRPMPAGQDGPKIAEEVLTLFEDFTCTDCHRFHGQGETSAPDLTGYGSRAWLVGIITDPTQPRFYGKQNDGMPSYRMFPDKPEKNLLGEAEIELVARWIVGELPVAKRTAAARELKAD